MVAFDCVKKGKDGTLEVELTRGRITVVAIDTVATGVDVFIWGSGNEVAVLQMTSEVALPLTLTPKCPQLQEKGRGLVISDDWLHWQKQMNNT